MLLDKCAAPWTRLVALAALAVLAAVAGLATCRAEIESFHELRPGERVFLEPLSLGQNMTNLTSIVLERLYDPSRIGFTDLGSLAEMSHFLARLKITRSKRTTFLAIDDTGRMVEHPLTLGANDTYALESTWLHALGQRTKHLFKLPRPESGEEYPQELGPVMPVPTAVSFEGVEYRQPKPAVFGVSSEDYATMEFTATTLNQRDGASRMVLGVPHDWPAVHAALYTPELLPLKGGHAYGDVYRTRLLTPRTIEGRVQLTIRADGSRRREPVQWPLIQFAGTSLPSRVASFRSPATGRTLLSVAEAETLSLPKPGEQLQVLRTVPAGTPIALKWQAVRLQGGVGKDTELCSTLSELDALARMHYLQVQQISDLTPATLGIYFSSYQESRGPKRMFFVTELEWIDGRPLHDYEILTGVSFCSKAEYDMLLERGRLLDGYVVLGNEKYGEFDWTSTTVGPLKNGNHQGAPPRDGEAYRRLLHALGIGAGNAPVDRKRLRDPVDAREDLPSGKRQQDVPTTPPARPFVLKRPQSGRIVMPRISSRGVTLPHINLLARMAPKIRLPRAAIVELLYGEWAMANFAGLILHDRHGNNYIVQNVAYGRVIHIGPSAALCIPRDVPMVRRIDLGMSSPCKQTSCAARANKHDGFRGGMFVESTRPLVDPRLPAARDAHILKSARLTAIDNILAEAYREAREKVRVGIPPMGIEHALEDLRLLERQFTADRLLRLWAFLPQNHESDIWLDYLLRRGLVWDAPVVRALYALFRGASFPSVIKAYFREVLCNMDPPSDSIPGVRVYGV